MSRQSPKNRELLNLKYENQILLLSKISRMRKAFRLILKLVSAVMRRRYEPELEQIMNIADEHID